MQQSVPNWKKRVFKSKATYIKKQSYIEVNTTKAPKISVADTQFQLQARLQKRCIATSNRHHPMFSCLPINSLVLKWFQLMSECETQMSRGWRTWRRSGSGWTGLWASDLDVGMYPCSLQMGWTKWLLRVPSNSNNSMILWYTYKEIGLYDLFLENVF